MGCNCGSRKKSANPASVPVTGPHLLERHDGSTEVFASRWDADLANARNGYSGRVIPLEES